MVALLQRIVHKLRGYFASMGARGQLCSSNVEWLCMNVVTLGAEGERVLEALASVKTPSLALVLLHLMSLLVHFKDCPCILLKMLAIAPCCDTRVG